MKKLLLIGAGPAHLDVMRALADEALPGAEVSWLAPGPRAICSRMLPGHVCGRWTLEACSVALAPLAERAGVRLLQAGVAAIDALDAAARRVCLADGRTLDYDALSLDLAGAATDRDAIAGAREHALFLRPAETFATLWERMQDLAERQPMCVVVVGSGAAAVEMALALQQRLGERSRISLVSGEAPPSHGILPGRSEALRERVQDALRRRQVTLLEDACVEITAQHVLLGRGTRVACDAAVLATPPCAPAWLRASGLSPDDRGALECGTTLQSRMHPEVFSAAGSRSGAALALNLRRFLAGGALEARPPAPRRLEAIACGDGRAVVGWRGWAIESRWAGRWLALRQNRAIAHIAQTNRSIP